MAVLNFFDSERSDSSKNSMTRIYEKDLDALFLKHFHTNRKFVDVFLRAAGIDFCADTPSTVLGQTKHKLDTGTIDFELQFSESVVFLVENKIDAGYSTTRAGHGQVDRYERSRTFLTDQGLECRLLLLAPRIYRLATKAAGRFDCYVDYEDLRCALAGEDLILLDAAIAQASTPYEPEPNLATADFFDGYREFAMNHYPSLIIKHSPNADGVRPTGSHTIYFDVPRTLRLHNDVPRPLMSLQCWDSTAPSASVKIMIGGCAKFYGRLRLPQSFTDIGAYLRPAGQSLGLVIDTPRLDTQVSIKNQLDEVAEGLEGAARLQDWWNHNGDVLRAWNLSKSS